MTMPYIAVNVSKSLTETEKDAIKSGLGGKISVIPGKSEKGLMVDIIDGKSMYYRGQKGDIAYLEVKLFGTPEPDAQKAFTEAAFDVMQQAGFAKKDVYITLQGFANWGVNGTLV